VTALVTNYQVLNKIHSKAL